MRRSLLALVLPLALLGLPACAPYSGRFVHDAAYAKTAVPPAPDYGREDSWAALPQRSGDASDVLPEGLRAYDPARDGFAPASVFWIHPTIYTDDPAGRFPWNGDAVGDAALNARVDETTIRFQASIFSGAGEVWAPRYRQAHISAYYTADTATARAAFDTAYADVRRAFRHFLRARRPGSPVVVAGHSQGTTHGKRLVREFFDGGAALADSLVAAYLVGIPVAPDYFAALPVCADSLQTGCFVSWRTWQRPATPADPDGDGEVDKPGADGPAVVVNPLTWSTDDAYAPAALNPGGTLRKFRLLPHLADAQVHDGVLWINRPDFFGKRVIRMRNWHAADYNLYYASVWRDARRRTRLWGAGGAGAGR